MTTKYDTVRVTGLAGEENGSNKRGILPFVFTSKIYTTTEKMIDPY